MNGGRLCDSLGYLWVSNTRWVTECMYSSLANRSFHCFLRSLFSFLLLFIAFSLSSFLSASFHCFFRSPPSIFDRRSFTRLTIALVIFPPAVPVKLFSLE